MPRRLLAVLAVLLAVLLRPAVGDEGMYPITELSKLNLKAKGLEIPVSEIYNPKGAGTSLIEAIVHLGGCSASFVSPEGLIITNHHCVFGAVSAASSVQNDYLTHGFLAPDRPRELPARGMTARITEEMRDVSAQVLEAVKPGVDPLARAQAIDARIGELTRDAQAKQPGKTITISEMLPGQSYLMFISTTYRDVRLVYVPPRSIGEFGGEDDNWVWPRHTGDFSFVRAYAGKDGAPADYSPDNVPYHPRRFLKVNPNGVNEEDFVFILGYPGRTYRHQSSYYLAYEEQHRMPFVAGLNQWQIQTLEQLGKGDRATALKFDSRIKGLANTMKNYRGKLDGMRKLGLTAARRAEEAGLQKFIEADPARRATYGTVLADTAKIYDEMAASFQYEMVLDNLTAMSTLIRAATAVAEAGGAAKPAPAVPGRGAANLFANYHQPAEVLFLQKIVSMAAGLPDGQRIVPLDRRMGGDYSEQNVRRAVDTSVSMATITSQDALSAAIKQGSDDPWVVFARELTPLQQQLRDTRLRRNAELSRLSALLLDVRQQYLKKDFIPDANSTLRFTYGRIRGYSPVDAVYHRPHTTLDGVMEKTRDEAPYDTPAAVRALARARDFGRFRLPKANQLPVALLYNLDTTGGNSGSALMNAKGELVGVNFDRAWAATINDYAWNEAYSRSIAVDIRYVLWVTEKVGKAGFLLKEMGVN